MSSRRAGRGLRDAAPVFAALGDAVRLHLVSRLSAGAPLSISRLSEGVPISRQAVTKHLHVLAGASLVTSVRKGREQIWQLNPDSIGQARQYLDLISREWDAGLGRLKTFVETSPPPAG